MFRLIIISLMLGYSVYTLNATCTMAIICQVQLLDEVWRKLARSQNEEWYLTTESDSVIHSILKFQQPEGGWPKNINTTMTDDSVHQQSDDEVVAMPKSTIDNGATTSELTLLYKKIKATPKPEYLDAFRNGLNYLLKAQYPNGGWPMCYPLREGYYSHITFNDDAFINVMRLLRTINEEKNHIISQLGNELFQKTEQAYKKGIECILRCQIQKNGTPTIWCAQHDEYTFTPVKARDFELASFSGYESANIVLFLMEIPSPNIAIIEAINGAVDWFVQHQLSGIKINSITLPDGKPDVVVSTTMDATPVWARFYDLKDGRAFFCDRDGVKRYSIEEIGYERRNGYDWFTTLPSKVIKRYDAWRKSLAHPTAMSERHGLNL